MAGSDEAGTSRVNDPAPDPEQRLKKSDIVCTAWSLRFCLTGEGPESVDLVRRGPGAPRGHTQAAAAAQQPPPGPADTPSADPEQTAEGEADADVTQQQATNRKRIRFDAAAVYRQHIEAAPKVANRRGDLVSRAKCTICNIELMDNVDTITMDNVDTITKHVGWITDDKDTGEGQVADPEHNLHQICRLRQKIIFGDPIA